MAEIGSIESITGDTIKIFDANYDNSEMDQEDFLKVLLAQYQYQDPFETQDVSKLIDDTVKLQELKVMQEFEDSVNMLNSNDTLFFNTTNLIDKTVLYEGDLTYVSNGTTEVEFIPNSDADQAILYLYDQEGQIISTQEFRDVKADTSYTFTLNDPEVADGYYQVSVVAKLDNEPITTTIYSTALITGIEKDGNEILAIYEEGAIPISSIERIGG
ncbi:MAG: flagellar hook capping protein [Epsilonproteobacteria bacterium]|nr:flagellar hook capping protein [Campylobacterota bacterium]